MWRQRLQGFGRGLLRMVLWALLILILLLLPVLAILGSETGSRWVLEQGVGMQKALSWEYRSGTLLTGLELNNVHLRTAKLDLHVRHVLARWSLVQLLGGEVELNALKAEGVALKMLTPPTGKPTQLPLLVLPVRLVIHDVTLQDISLLNWQAKAPLTLDRLLLAGHWRGARVRLDRLLADQKQIGRLQLQGTIRLRGGYPLDLKGSLAYKPFLAQGWQPVSLQLSQEVADLALQLDSRGPLTATASGHIKPLQPALPYSMTMQWQPVELPWLKDQALVSQGGTLRVAGDKAGMQTQGDANLGGRQLPSGQYVWRAHTNWKSADIESFNFIGLGGDLKVKGNVSWQQGIAWNLAANANQLDLAKHWPVPHSAVPVLTGKLDSKGHTSKQGSGLTASVRLAGGESWDLQEKGRSWVWDLQAPQDIGLKWAGVRRQVPGLESLLSDSGSLDFKGALPDYQLTLDAGLQSPRLPAGRWTVALAGQHRHMDIDHLDYHGEAGSLGFGGELDLGPSVQWQGALVLGDFSTAWVSKDWSGQFSGHVAGRGVWGKEVREAHLEDTHLTGLLRDQPVVVDGALALRLPVTKGRWPEAWTSSGLKLVWGKNQVFATGGLRERQWGLAADVQLGDLSLLVPQMKGGLQGHVAVQGEEALPDIQADLQGAGIGTAAVSARAATIALQLQKLGQGASSLHLKADDLATSAGTDLGNVQLDLTGTRSAHTLGWQAGNERIKSTGSLSGGLEAGSLDWHGNMEAGDVSLPALQWRLAAPFAVDWAMADRQLELAAHCWVSDEARLCNEAPMQVGPTGRLQWSLKGLQAQRLGGLLPEGLGLSGLITGQASGGWQPGQHPVLKADLHADNGAVSLARDEPSPPLQVAYQRISLTMEAVADKVQLQFDLASSEMGKGRAIVAIDPYTDDKALQGTVSLQGLRLDILKPFLPTLETLAGTVSADGRLEGTLARPLFWGAVVLADGEVGVQGLPVNINSINARVDVKGTAVDISGSMRSGEGTAALNGQADWATSPKLDMTLKGERFELRREPELLAEIAPDLRLQVVPGQVDLTGTIRVPMARLNIKSLATKAVPLSSDVTIVSADGSDRVQLSRTMASWAINADVSVLLGDDVFFHGYGVNGRLMGGLRLRQQGKKGLEANGEVELDKDSRYDAYGQRLLIRRGRLIFAGNLTQPGLDVEAVREIDGKVVGVRVEGRANAPEATLFSDSAMSQEEIISYLVLGRPLDTSGKPESGQNLSAAAAAIKIGATGGAGLGLTDKIGDTFGITDLAVDAEGNGDDTQFTVSGYLSPKLYLRYGVGIFTPVNTATIRYKINAKVYLEAVSSLDSAIDLFYNWRF